ncbi:hypothetical protein AD998_15925 [bacterium 336/3]|nr:hypothetical protein AD998_15925 [bacterium 336/3]
MNTLTQYFVPQWISIAFLIAIPLPFILIAILIRKEAERIKHTLAFPLIVAFFILYLTYISFASLNGWFNEVSLPPKVLLFTTFPYALFLFGVLLNTKTYQNIIENVLLENLIQLHIFRLIGVFFVLLAIHDALPKPFAFIAGFGDILTAISSIFVVKAIQNKRSYAKKLTFYWNIFGTVDILFTAIAANILTKISIDTNAMGVDTLAVFPFCIIPAFAPPTILFIHWAIFKKIKNFSV